MTCVLLLLLALQSGLSGAQTVERDIIDAALARTQRTARSGQTSQYGDSDLDAAVRALQDDLPRPWTVPVMVVLFETATAEWLGRMQQARETGQTQPWERRNELSALIDHVSAILAASRDPRAVLVLMRWVEAGDTTGFLNGSLVMGLSRHVLADPSYQRLPAPDGPAFSTNLLPIMSADVQRWWEMNRDEVTRRAAAFPTSTVGACPDCQPDEASARALIAKLVDGASHRQPRLHVSFEGPGTPRFVQLQAIFRPTSGTAYSSMQRLSADSADIVLQVPRSMLGERALSLRALVMSPGYRTVSLDVPDTSLQPQIPVAFIRLPDRTLKGTVAFKDGAVPRAFTLGVDVWIEGARGSSSVFAGAGSTLQGFAETMVGGDGAFTLVLPDLAQDALMSVPGVEMQFRFRAVDVALALTPDRLSVGRAADGVLALTAAPRPPRTDVPRAEAPR